MPTVFQILERDSLERGIACSARSELVTPLLRIRIDPISEQPFRAVTRLAYRFAGKQKTLAPSEILNGSLHGLALRIAVSVSGM